MNPNCNLVNIQLERHEKRQENRAQDFQDFNQVA